MSWVQWLCSWDGSLLTDSELTDTWKLRELEYITEILRRLWPISANKIKSSESGSKQPTQLVVELNSSLRHIIATIVVSELAKTTKTFCRIKSTVLKGKVQASLWIKCYMHTVELRTVGRATIAKINFFPKGHKKWSSNFPFIWVLLNETSSCLQLYSYPHLPSLKLTGYHHYYYLQQLWRTVRRCSLVKQKVKSKIL